MNTPIYLFDLEDLVYHASTLLVTELPLDTVRTLIAKELDLIYKKSLLSSIYKRNEIYPPGEDYTAFNISDYVDIEALSPKNPEEFGRLLDLMLGELTKYFLPDYIYSIYTMPNSSFIHVREIGNIYRLRYEECLIANEIEIKSRLDWKDTEWLN